MEKRALRVPGVLELLLDRAQDGHEIFRGDLAGYGLVEDLRDWKNSYTFVALEDLSPEDRRRVLPALANAVLEPEPPPPPPPPPSAHAPPYRTGDPSDVHRPKLRKLLSGARLAWLDAKKGRATKFPLRGPYRIVEVGFARNADDYFHVAVTRDQEELVSIHGASSSIVGHLDPMPDDVDYLHDRFLERIVRAASGGLVSSGQLALAFEMHALRSSAALDAWEARLTCSAEDAALANEIVDVLRRAGEADSVDLPTYGVARRERHSRVVVRSSDAVGELEAWVKVGSDRELVVPAEDVWKVDDVAEAHSAAEPPRVTPVHASHARGRRLLALFVAVFVFIAFVILLRRARW